MSAIGTKAKRDRAVGDAIGHEQLVAVADRAAGIDDVGHIALAVLVRPRRGSARACGRSPSTDRPCRAAPRRSNICASRRRRGSAAASPRRARSAGRNCRSGPAPTGYVGVSSISPSSQWVERVGREQEEVLAVLPADHHVLAADLAREQRHALVARGAAGHRHQIERAEVAWCASARTGSASRYRRYRCRSIRPSPSSCVELDEAQILQPVRLRLGDREDHRAGQRRIAVAIDGHRARRASAARRCRSRRRRWRRAARAPASARSRVGDDPLAERDRRDVPLAHRAQRHQDAQRSRAACPTGRNAAPRWGSSARRRHSCIRGRNRRRSAGASRRRYRAPFEPQHVLDLVVARHEHAPRLPVARLEILEHHLELLARFGRRHRQHFARPAARCGSAPFRCLPRRCGTAAPRRATDRHAAAAGG